MAQNTLFVNQMTQHSIKHLLHSGPEDVKSKKIQSVVINQIEWAWVRKSPLSLSKVAFWRRSSDLWGLYWQSWDLVGSYWSITDSQLWKIEVETIKSKSNNPKLRLSFEHGFNINLWPDFYCTALPPWRQCSTCAWLPSPPRFASSSAQRWPQQSWILFRNSGNFTGITQVLLLAY